jgi:hypothetical protein
MDSTSSPAARAPSNDSASFAFSFNSSSSSSETNNAAAWGASEYPNAATAPSTKFSSRSLTRARSFLRPRACPDAAMSTMTAPGTSASSSSICDKSQPKVFVCADFDIAFQSSQKVGNTGAGSSPTAWISLSNRDSSTLPFLLRLESSSWRHGNLRQRRGILNPRASCRDAWAWIASAFELRLVVGARPLCSTVSRFVRFAIVGTLQFQPQIAQERLAATHPPYLDLRFGARERSQNEISVGIQFAVHGKRPAPQHRESLVASQRE